MAHSNEDLHVGEPVRLPEEGRDSVPEQELADSEPTEIGERAKAGLDQAVEELRTNADRLPEAALPEERAMVDEGVVTGEAAAADAAASIDEVLEPTADGDEVQVTIDYSSIQLQEVLNQIRIAERFAGDAELVPQQEASKFVSSTALEGDPALMDSIQKLLDGVGTEKAVPGEVIDLISSTLRLPESAITNSVKQLDQLLFDQAQKTVMAAEQAERVAGGKMAIAKKMGLYLALGSTLAVMGAGIGGAAAMGAIRTLDNTRIEVGRNKKIQAEIKKQRIALLNEPPVRSAYLKELTILLSEKKQQQISQDEGKAVILSTDQIALRLAESVLPDQYRVYTEAREAVRAEQRQHPIDEAALAEAKIQLTEALAGIKDSIQAEGLDKLVDQLTTLQRLDVIQAEAEAKALSKGGLLESAANGFNTLLSGGNNLTERNVTTAVFTMSTILARSVPGLRNALGAMTGARVASGIARWKNPAAFEGGVAHGGISKERLAEIANTDQDKVGIALAQARQRLADDRALSPSQREALKVQVTTLENDLIKSGALSKQRISELAQQAIAAEQKRKTSKTLRQKGVQIAGAAVGWFIPDMAHAAADFAIHSANAADGYLPETNPTVAPNQVEVQTPTNTPETSVAPAMIAETASPATLPTAELAKHVIGSGDGISHGMVGQVSRGEMNALLNDTKVVIDGKTVSLMDTGVAGNGGDVSVIVSEQNGHKVVDLYDARTGAKIDPNHAERYLYDRNGDRVIQPETRGGVLEQTEPEPQELPAEQTVEPPPELNRFVIDGVREWLATDHTYDDLDGASDQEILTNPVFKNLRDDLQREWLATHGEAAEQALGDVGHVATPEAASTLSLDGLVDTAKERLTERGIQALGLEQHISNGQPQPYGQFRADILKLLAADERERITGPNGLIFEERAGELYVDVKGGAREHFVLTEDLYKALMAEYKTDVATNFDGQFDKETFHEALDDAKVEHDFHLYERSEVSLGKMPHGINAFTEKMKELMATHDREQLTGTNGLTYTLKDEKLYVSQGAFKYELTPQLYDALYARYQELLRTPDRRGVFDADRFHAVIDSVEGRS